MSNKTHRVKFRIHEVGNWVCTIKFHQLCCIFEKFHNKMTGEALSWSYLSNIHPMPVINYSSCKIEVGSIAT